jgi:lipopolysaccharide heptosyltransferase II
LGDIVHALPVLSALRQRFPQSQITWVVNQSYQPLLIGHPHLTETLAFDRGIFRQAPGTVARYLVEFGNHLRRRRFDLVIDLQGLLRTGLMCGWSGAPVRIGFADAREGSRYFYTHQVRVPDADRIHAVDRYWRIMDVFDVRGVPKEFILPIQPNEQIAADRELAGLPRPIIAIAAGARWITKRWPVGNFAVLANRCVAEFGGSVVLVGSADDRALSQHLASELTAPHLDLTGRTSLPRLVAILSRCDVMMANDTGPLHLAAALGRPCVAPYTCTKTVLHGPYGVGGGIETRVPCAGSYLRVCPHDFRCFADLTPDTLWPALAERLSSWRPHCRSDWSSPAAP